MRVHFIAIGGAIMHNLAICLQELNHKVSGSDDIIFDPARKNLEQAGLLPPNIGFFKDNITSEMDAIILGMHAKKDNIELLEAQRLGIAIYSFPEFIYKESVDKKRVVIAGSHGKTTTTAMIMHVLQAQNMSFDYMVGSSLEGFERSVKLSDAPIIILEGDEYLSSPLEMRSKFHFYKADIALITGIAWDHVNVFPSLKSYYQTFEQFISELHPKSILFWFEEDMPLQKMIEYAPCKTETYATPNYRIEQGKSIIKEANQDYLLKIFGKHNLQNLEGAKKVCRALGISDANFYQSIASFSGTAKRLEQIKLNNRLLAFKDFAHSPSKLLATVNAVSEQFKPKKLIACMELHTFSSTDPNFLSEFKNCFNQADVAIIYMSEKNFSLKNKANIEDHLIHKNFNNKNILVFREPEALKAFIKVQNLEEAVLLLMSSGNYDGIEWDTFLNSYF